MPNTYARWIAEAIETANARLPDGKRRWTYASLGRAMADRLGVAYDRSKIQKMTVGRKISAAEAAAISDILAVEMPETVATPRLVKILGFVGAGGELHFYDGRGPFGEAQMPAGVGQDTVAVEIRGDALGANLAGWVAYFDARRTPPTPDMLDQLCVVCLDDGRVLVRRLKEGRAAGRYDLFVSYGDPQLDQAVAWAARVTAIMPR
jgi:hypothetical protein